MGKKRRKKIGTTNKQRKRQEKKLSKAESMASALTGMDPITPETKTDISSDDSAPPWEPLEEPIATVIDGQPRILMPGSEAYTSAFEQVYGKPGPVSYLGEPRPHPKKETLTVAAKTGSIDIIPDPDRKVMLFRDHALDYPELWYSVYVVGPPEDTKGFAQLFGRAYCNRAESLEDADLVVFTGGPDVDPAYYGETPHGSTYTAEERDIEDIKVYQQCLDLGIPMTGVCRGAQFLAVMNGYKLYQDVNNHHGDHAMWDCGKKMMLEKVSSVHHQQVIPGVGMEIVGISHKSTERWRNADNHQVAADEKRPFVDVEAFFIRDTCCIGVQGHPEYRGYNAFAKWYLELIYEYVGLNIDITSEDHHLRLKPEILEQRELPEMLLTQGGDY